MNENVHYVKSRVPMDVPALIKMIITEAGIVSKPAGASIYTPPSAFFGEAGQCSLTYIVSLRMRPLEPHEIAELSGNDLYELMQVKLPSSDVAEQDKRNIVPEAIKFTEFEVQLDREQTLVTPETIDKVRSALSGK